MDNDFDLANFGDDIFEDFTKNAPQVAAENTAARKRKIPVVMVSGFLGAGKTSLLNNILRDSPQLKIGAIVNDFGKINIDNRLVSGTFSENQIELSNGCICCMLGDNGLREPLEPNVPWPLNNRGATPRSPMRCGCPIRVSSMPPTR